MKNKITIQVRAFPVKVQDQRTGEESVNTILFTKQQLQAAQTMEPKICPLFWASTNDGAALNCLGERCAWYVPPDKTLMREGCCAVQALGALPELAKEVRQL